MIALLILTNLIAKPKEEPLKREMEASTSTLEYEGLN